MTSCRVRVRRIYEEASPEDGRRVLVDRVWPRGLTRDAAHLHEWTKAVAPSTGLRRWYGHDPAKFDEFRRRYRDELDGRQGRDALHQLRLLSAQGTLTLLTASKDVAHSQAAVLAELLGEDEMAQPPEPAEEGGEPACWLTAVCPECGCLADQDRPSHCPACGVDVESWRY